MKQTTKSAMESSSSLSTARRILFPRLGIMLFAGAAALLVNTPHTSEAQQAPAAKSDTKTSPTKAPAAASKPHEEPDGEQVFAANCSRCHTAPDGFSQRISGTVVHHMRVRASLSAEDEKALMRFFNPQ